MTVAHMKFQPFLYRQPTAYKNNWNQKAEERTNKRNYEEYIRIQWFLYTINQGGRKVMKMKTEIGQDERVAK